jgi:hypothetical protein
MTQIVLQGHFDAADRARNAFPLLPFEVEPGTAGLRIDYWFSQQIGADRVGQQAGNIVDIGLFDPRGADFLSAEGFRGWSGSSKQAFAISEREATPGYVPGPILAGTWHVVLGLYQLAPEGCDYRVTVTPLEKEKRDEEDAQGSVPREMASPADRTARQAQPRPGTGPRWHRGDLHTHTHHSDGTAPLSDLVAVARAQGLDFVAVTDHNTVSHLPLLPAFSRPDLLLIPGVEITTYHGHANVWPADWPGDRFFEFRCSTDEQMARVRGAMRERGKLFSINHPKQTGPPWEFGRMFEPDCIEVWGGPWVLFNTQSLAVWDARLRQGQRIVAVGGSDKHQAPFTGELTWYEVGAPCTWVYAEDLTVEAIVDGIRAGRVFISEGPAGPRIELRAEQVGGPARASIGEELRLPAGSSLRLTCRIDSKGNDATGNILRLVSASETLEAAITGDDFCHEWQVAVTGPTYWRAEVIEPPQLPLDENPSALVVKALSNPIYAKRP